MFGIDFSEFLVIGVIALIVLGPERLPKVARTAGHLFGRLQRYAADIKQQVKHEMEAEDFKQIQSQFQEVKDAASGIENSIHQEAAQTKDALMTTSETPPPSSLEFVEEPPAAPIADPSLQLELPLVSAEPAHKPAADQQP